MINYDIVKTIKSIGDELKEIQDNMYEFAYSELLGNGFAFAYVKDEEIKEKRGDVVLVKSKPTKYNSLDGNNYIYTCYCIKNKFETMYITLDDLDIDYKYS